MNGEPQPVSEPRARLRQLPDPLRVARVIGGLLCLAAGLKIFDLFDYPPEGIGWGLSAIASAVELVVGVALIFRPSASVPVATLLFILLTTLTMIGTGRRVPRCDCLGPVPLPMWAMMSVDAAATAVLFWILLGSGRRREHPIPVLAGTSIGAAFLGLMIGSMLYPTREPVAPSLQAELASSSTNFTIEPLRFRGRPFYLIPFIDINADLSQGKWKVIITRPGCPRCDRGLRSAGCRPEGDERVAIILRREKTDWTPPAECEAVRGHLNDKKSWSFRAPLIFQIVDGQVVEAH